MTERSIIDQLDDAVAATVVRRASDLNLVGPEIAMLVAVAQELAGLPSEDFKAQLKEQLTRRDSMSSPEAKTDEPNQSSNKGRREGFHSVTPYMTVERPAELIDFVTKAFGATENFRTVGSAGGMHAEVKIGDSMVMIGGGGGIPGMPTAIHLYVPDVDDAYRRALDVGAISLFEPADQPYGERSGAVQDLNGNRWYIATTFVPLAEIDKDLHTVTQYFHPIGAPRFIEFLKSALGAEEVMREASGDHIHHAKVRI